SETYSAFHRDLLYMLCPTRAASSATSMMLVTLCIRLQKRPSRPSEAADSGEARTHDFAAAKRAARRQCLTFGLIGK
ncbi:MAG: hypothetical protein WCC81_11140, partial [Pseudolabrys sp.]